MRIYIPHGGIVFLWPFFSQLFHRQGLLEEGEFVDEAAQHNAVHALQYWSTELIGVPEHELMLSKLLCGMSYDDVLASGYYCKEEGVTYRGSVSVQGDTVQNTPVEIMQLKKNAQEVLHVAMQQWEKLKKFSVLEQYREGFTAKDLKAYFFHRSSILQRVEDETEDRVLADRRVSGGEHDLKDIRSHLAVYTILKTHSLPGPWRR